MNKTYLKNHIKLCKKNLKRTNIKCCLTCPFEKEIIKEYPEMKKLFLNAKIINQFKKVTTDIKYNPVSQSNLSKRFNI
jgi:hypothetical protein